jgi:hypothetical protein
MFLLQDYGGNWRSRVQNGVAMCLLCFAVFSSLPYAAEGVPINPGDCKSLVSKATATPSPSFHSTCHWMINMS